jgi:hypothetical protein
MAGKTVTLRVPCRKLGKEDFVEFKVGFVSNWVTREYKELTEDALSVWQEAQELKSGNKSVKEADSEVFKRAENLLDRKYALVQEILETNGYEFDHKFWDRKTEPQAVNDFIAQAVHKDLVSGKKKA